MIESVQQISVNEVETENINKDSSSTIIQCNDIEEEFIGKRRRSSSMDILAEAASATCSTSSYSGQTSRASDDWDDDLEHKRSRSLAVDNDAALITAQLNDKIDKSSSSASSSACNNNTTSRRTRSATFSYSPFTSKDPDLFSPQSGEKFRTLNWIANLHEDEHTTADLLSNLSQFKVSTLTPL